MIYETCSIPFLATRCQTLNRPLNKPGAPFLYVVITFYLFFLVILQATVEVGSICCHLTLIYFPVGITTILVLNAPQVHKTNVPLHIWDFKKYSMQ